MSKRSLGIFIALTVIVIIIVFFLNPCGSELVQNVSERVTKFTPKADTVEKKPLSQSLDEKEAKVNPADKDPVAAQEIDNTPPVTLTTSEQIPNVAKCAIANFPNEAKPHVNLAVVTVRLIVDKFGNVRSVTPLDVEFPQEPPEDILPVMRKLFIKAGSKAFGARKCPPHVVNGQNVGYAIEVPLQYKH